MALAHTMDVVLTDPFRLALSRGRYVCFLNSLWLLYIRWEVEVFELIVIMAFDKADETTVLGIPVFQPVFCLQVVDFFLVFKEVVSQERV